MNDVEWIALTDDELSMAKRALRCYAETLKQMDKEGYLPDLCLQTEIITIDSILEKID